MTRAPGEDSTYINDPVVERLRMSARRLEEDMDLLLPGDPRKVILRELAQEYRDRASELENMNTKEEEL